MSKKTLYIAVLILSIACLGCAAEIEYWTKRMDENEPPPTGVGGF